MTSVGSAIWDRGEAFEDGRADSLVDRLTDDQIRSEIVRPLVGPFYVLIFMVFGLVAIAGWRTVRREPGVSAPALASRGGSVECVTSGGVPVVNLLPWWRVSVPSVALFGGIAVIAAVIAAVGLRTPIRDTISGPATIIGGITALTLLLDILLDAFTLSFPLSAGGVTGGNPTTGRRAFLWVEQCHLCDDDGGSATHGRMRGRGARAHSSQGLGRRFCGDGWSTDGSYRRVGNVGGRLWRSARVSGGLCPADFAVCRDRLTPIRLLGVLIAAMGTSFVFAMADYMKPPPQRSHLGRFIQTLLDGEGFDIVTRKLSRRRSLDCRGGWS